jgi:hypothetical protein
MALRDASRGGDTLRVVAAREPLEKLATGQRVGDGAEPRADETLLPHAA